MNAQYQKWYAVLAPYKPDINVSSKILEDTILQSFEDSIAVPCKLEMGIASMYSSCLGCLTTPNTATN